MFPVIIITGARQAGKTTLARAAFPDHAYVSLDLPSVAEQAEREPAAFFKDHPPPVVIDEIQYAPLLFRHVKALVDEKRHEMGRFVLTGSQGFGLMKGVSESLAGRCAILELENLSFAELSTAGLAPATSGDRLGLLARGQFPELWRDRSLASGDFYSAYVATYIQRDVRQLTKVASLRDFERFMRILATRSGRLLNKTDVAKDVGVSVPTIGAWISVLLASGQIAFAEPWFASFGKRVVRSPKLHFRDTGLLCFLLNLDQDGLAKSPFLGAVWESYLFSELRKLALADGSGARFWSYRDQRAREIDLVVERGGELSLVEAKWTESPGAADCRAILEVAADIESAGGPWRAGRHYVVARAAARHPLGPGIEAIRDLDLPSILE